MSKHDNYHNDRKWRFDYCNLNRKCSILTKMKLHTKKQTITSGFDSRITNNIMDNRKGSRDLKTSLMVTESGVEWLEESYMFGASETQKFGQSLELSATFGFDFLGKY